jgi:hypothetical protein
MPPGKSGVREKWQVARDDVTHLDDLVYSILYVTGQGGCDGVRKVRDPEGFCDILWEESERVL